MYVRSVEMKARSYRLSKWPTFYYLSSQLVSRNCCKDYIMPRVDALRQLPRSKTKTDLLRDIPHQIAQSGTCSRKLVIYLMVFYRILFPLVRREWEEYYGETVLYIAFEYDLCISLKVILHLYCLILIKKKYILQEYKTEYLFCQQKFFSCNDCSGIIHLRFL